MEADKNISSIIKVEEIVDFINRLGLKVDRNIVESTDSDTIVELISSALEKIGILKKERLKINYKGMDLFSYNGLHDRPILILKLFKLTRKFFTEILRIENYTASDLFNPNPKRTRKILGKLLLFHRFKQEQNKEVYNALLSSFEENEYRANESSVRYEKERQALDSKIIERQYDRQNIEKCKEELSNIKNTMNQKDMELKDIKDKEKEVIDQIAEFDSKNVN
jgi:hypothetical protein